MAVGEAGGDVEEPVAQRFGFGFREVTVEADDLGPSEQARREHRDGGPGLIADVVSNGRFVMPVAFQQRTRSSTRA